MTLRRLTGLAITLVISTLLFLTAAQASRVEIIISKVSQKMTVKVDGDTEYVWPVSTGAARYETPSGNFRPFRMEAEHFSKEWDDAPMPHSIFFTGQGHAIHGSYHVKSLGSRASHGCVRLAPENAEILFDLVKENGMANTRVVLKGGFFDFGSGVSRSFADVGDEIDKVVKKKPYRGFFWNLSQPKKRIVAVSSDKKVKKVATQKVDAKAKKPELKAKDGKTCPKAAPIKAASAG
jgi:L,D-transpeptidase catalytic domain